jgi:DNA polymerase-1
MVVTGDRDAYQLVGDGVRVMSTSRGVTDTKIYDREGVIERYGVAPELVPDLIGLKGDTSDNIPGVPGIGEKTASQLLQEFGSLEGVLDNIESISGPKRKQNLTEHGEDARISKQLATMHTDIDVELDLPALMERGPDLSQLRETAAEFELRQVIQRLEDDWEGDVPDRPADDLIDVDATEGTIADLGDGEIALAITAGAGAATTADASSPASCRNRPTSSPRSPAIRSSPMTSSRWPGTRRAGSSPTSPPARSTSPTTRWSPPI